MGIEREIRRFANRRKPGKVRTKCRRCGTKLVNKPGYGIICPECGYQEKEKKP